MPKNYLFTSESVSEGHPDKICDQISDSLVDVYLKKDPFSRLAIETFATTNRVIIGGEIRAPEVSKSDIDNIVRNAVKEIGAGLPAEELSEMISRASLSVAYGESLTNLLQPFFLLLVFPIMGAGIKIQARDVMGYLVIPFLIFFVIQSILVTWIPL